MTYFDSHHVLSLRKMAMTKFAITVCRDPEIIDLVKDNGCTSFIFPSKVMSLFCFWKGPGYGENPRVDPSQYLIKVQPTEVCQLRLLPDRFTLDSHAEHANQSYSRWEELVEERISSLPPILQPELLDVIRSVSIEVDKWLKYHSQFLQNSSETARCAGYDFQWNSLGKIDSVRTAGALIRNERLHIEDRCILAVHYDLIDKIPIEVNVLLEIVQKYPNLTWRGCINDVWQEFIGEYSNNARDKKLIDVGHARISLSAVPSKEFIAYNEFRLLLARMTDDMKKQTFKKCAYKVLQLYFLDWPLQSEFLEVAEQLLPYFNNRNEFLSLIRKILFERIMLGRKDFNYINLLKELWSISPSHLKESIRNHPFYPPFLFTLNLPVCENFPIEKLIRWLSREDDYLSFGSSGITYCFFLPFSARINARALVVQNSFLFNFGCQFITLFCVPFGKRKFPQITDPGDECAAGPSSASDKRQKTELKDVNDQSK
ncbi:uncharacterized protein TNCV_1139901 [Trichonephila clavipes]|nr:uncharacterized protein TNCV_1139901 [Trichonephila clavipes]